MKTWLVEVFANGQLNRLFWLTTACSAPFWVMMIGFPQTSWTRRLCRLWLAPPLLGAAYVYLLYLAYTITGVPEVQDVEMKTVRRFWGHPILFIALWMHRMALDLFVGTWIYQFGRVRGWNVRVELALVWIAGPAGVAAFAARYWIMLFLVRTRRSGFG